MRILNKGNKFSSIQSMVKSGLLSRVTASLTRIWGAIIRVDARNLVGIYCAKFAKTVIIQRALFNFINIYVSEYENSTSLCTHE